MPSFTYENKLAREGFQLIAGVDEAGRGPLAGPIVAAAVILPLDRPFPGLNDSKKLTARQRNRLFAMIKKRALAIGIGIVGHRQIDRINIGQANRLVMRLAVEKLALAPDCLLVDGTIRIPAVGYPQLTLVNGDGRCNSVAAASIIAKVTRDRIMDNYHKKYPHYGFNRHKGYATREHICRLAEHGPCPIHRRSFAYVA